MIMELPAGCRSKKLDHGIDEGGGLTGTGSTDNQRMCSRIEIHLKVILLIQHRADRNTVLLRSTLSALEVWGNIYPFLW